jgi:hypothetical protein
MARAARLAQNSRRQQNAEIASISVIRTNTASEHAKAMRRKTGLMPHVELSAARTTQNNISNEEVIYG